MKLSCNALSPLQPIPAKWEAGWYHRNWLYVGLILHSTYMP